MKRLLTGVAPIVALFALLLVSLYLMSAATQNSEEFGRLYFALLLINVVGLVLLMVLIATNLARLVRQYRNRATGSRLTVRLVVVFVIVALMPVSVVYYFSVEFLQRGIDSWFDVRIEKALDDALELSRLALDDRKRQYLRRTQLLAEELVTVPEDSVAPLLNDLRVQSEAYELTVLSGGGRIVASSSVSPLALMPQLPGEVLLMQVRQGATYVGLDTIPEAGLTVRVLVGIPAAQPIAPPRLVQALYQISGNTAVLAENVQSAIARYKQLAYLRGPLKFSFTFTLSLVLLLSLLAAVWAAFFAARRLVAPIRVLAIGTRAVAAGDYGKQLPQYSSDELGFLVRSFNEMTHRIAQARDEVELSKRQAEGERAYLRAVLERLSSGVLTLGRRRIIGTANAAAGQILGVDLKGYAGRPLIDIGREHARLRRFVDAIRGHLGDRDHEWREEITLSGAAGQQVLICSSAALPGAGGRHSGSVIVFEDVTALVQAQREAAWGEVARRLAHEIKNPLTPIRLSAERLRHKYLKEMRPQDAEILDRSTHTIVQQVEVMKEMVKAFSDYARPPRLSLSPSDINSLVAEVLDMYRGGGSAATLVEDLDPDLPQVTIDAGRIRQLLHNLVKNSLEACAGRPDSRIVARTACVTAADTRVMELRVEDNGPGIPDDMLGRFFEPYVTTKPKGSGLGLAIVKKIVEEHGGSVWAEPSPAGGAAIVIRLPFEQTLRAGSATGGERRAGTADPGAGQGRPRSERRRRLGA